MGGKQKNHVYKHIPWIDNTIKLYNILTTPWDSPKVNNLKSFVENGLESCYNGNLLHIV